MTTVAVDLDLLNELIDNQKKLDDVLDSMFDEALFLSSSKSVSDHAPEVSTQKGRQDLVGFNSNEDMSFNFEDESVDQKNRKIIYYVAMAAEVSAIAYGLSYLA